MRRRSRSAPPAYTREAVKRSAKIAAPTAIAGLLLALGVVFGGAPRAGAEPPAPTEQQALDSILRLTELPTGYVLGGRHFCELPRRPSEEVEIVAVGDHSPPTPYEVFLGHTATSGCVFAYERLYRTPGAPAGPPAVISFTLATPSVAAATEALAEGQLSEELGAGEIAEAVVERGFRAAGSPPAVGEGARRFRTNSFYWDELADKPATMVIWHQGKLVAGILAGGAKPAVNDAAADRYAALQQKLVEAPRPYDEAESEDIPTFLGNPNLGVPVYWLGKQFTPRGKTLSFSFSRADARPHLEQPGVDQRMSIEYGPELYLDSWTPGGWRKFSRTASGRRQSSPLCTRARSVKLPEGHAVIYASRGKGGANCPYPAIPGLATHVFLPGVVIAVGELACPHHCETILAPSINDFASMESLVRRLHRWRPGDAG
jgi:hypothetical protein